LWRMTTGKGDQEGELEAESVARDGGASNKGELEKWPD
jgi:hypothetical protein